MLILALGETVDQLAMGNIVRWYGHLLKKDRIDLMRGALDFEVMGTMKRGRPKILAKGSYKTEYKCCAEGK